MDLKEKTLSEFADEIYGKAYFTVSSIFCDTEAEMNGMHNLSHRLLEAHGKNKDNNSALSQYRLVCVNARSVIISLMSTHSNFQKQFDRMIIEIDKHLRTTESQ